MNLQLDNKTALVSGSTAGIGLAIAKALAGEGARVIVNGRTQARVDEAIAAIGAAHPGAKLEALPADLATAEGAAAAAAKFPEIDILVNNLGIFEPKPFEQIPDSDWQRFFDVNVLSGVRLSRTYVDGMRRRNWGRIVFISSESGIQIPAEMIHYGMTKTANLAVSRGLAEYCAGTGVTVNAVLPGPTRSEGVDQFVDQLSGGILRLGAAEFADQAFRDDGRSRVARRLCVQSAGLGHHRRCTTRRWGRGEGVFLAEGG
jgi:NAD(P)-dependent dehydrogenase (short-subunit alcohol dehydrogenase family)